VLCRYSGKSGGGHGGDDLGAPIQIRRECLEAASGKAVTFVNDCPRSRRRPKETIMANEQEAPFETEHEITLSEILYHEKILTEGLKQKLIRVRLDNEKRSTILLQAQMKALGLEDIVASTPDHGTDPKKAN